jgi:hypothetical protein
VSGRPITVEELSRRLDPRSEHRDPDLARRGLRVILICHESFQSSLAAATLRPGR